MSRKLSWLKGLIILLCLVLTGCGAVSTDLYLSKGPEYRVVSKVTVPADQVAASGGVEALDQQAQQTAAQAQDHGINVSWKRSEGSAGAVVYSAETTLTKVSTDRNDYFSLTPVTYEGQSAYRFVFTFFDEILNR